MADTSSFIDETFSFKKQCYYWKTIFIIFALIKKYHLKELPLALTVIILEVIKLFFMDYRTGMLVLTKSTNELMLRRYSK
jgi:hypothetical protein